MSTSRLILSSHKPDKHHAENPQKLVRTVFFFAVVTSKIVKRKESFTAITFHFCDVSHDPMMSQKQALLVCPNPKLAWNWVTQNIFKARVMAMPMGICIGLFQTFVENVLLPEAFNRISIPLVDNRATFHIFPDHCTSSLDFVSQCKPTWLEQDSMDFGGILHLESSTWCHKHPWSLTPSHLCQDVHNGLQGIWCGMAQCYCHKPNCLCNAKAVCTFCPFVGKWWLWQVPSHGFFVDIRQSPDAPHQHCSATHQGVICHWRFRASCLRSLNICVAGKNNTQYDHPRDKADKGACGKTHPAIATQSNFKELVSLLQCIHQCKWCLVVVHWKQ